MSSQCLSPDMISSSTTARSVNRTTSNAQLRKIKKPLIERRRRERINECLVQLKSLVLEAMNKDESRYSKMEKADILEMTVLHLKAVQRQMSLTTLKSPTRTSIGCAADQLSPRERYVIGFNECAQHVTQYLSEQRREDDTRFGLITRLQDDCLGTTGLGTPPTLREEKLDSAEKGLNLETRSELGRTPISGVGLNSKSEYRVLQCSAPNELTVPVGLHSHSMTSTLLCNAGYQYKLDSANQVLSGPLNTDEEFSFKLNSGFQADSPIESVCYSNVACASVTENAGKIVTCSEEQELKNSICPTNLSLSKHTGFDSQGNAVPIVGFTDRIYHKKYSKSLLKRDVFPPSVDSKALPLSLGLLIKTDVWRPW